MNYGIFSQNCWLFPDSAVNDGHQSEVLTLLKGQTCGLQILVDSLPIGVDINWNTHGLDAVDVKVYRIMEVCVNRNTNNLQCGALTTSNWEEVAHCRVRQAPYRTYDPLVPAESLKTENAREVYYVSFCPAKDADAGLKRGAVRLSFGAEVISIPIELTVCNKALPESTLNLTNWTGIQPMTWPHGIEYGTAEHDEMFRKYVNLLLDCHNHIFWVKFDDLKATKENGKIVFDFSQVKHWAQLALDCGIQKLEWSHIITRPRWEDPPFQVRDLTDGGKVLNCLATDGRKYLTAFLRQFNDFLTENGWRDISLVHISDEPKERCADDFRILAGIFRKYLPGIKLMDAVEIYFIEDALDIYVPKNHYYQLNKNDFEALRDDRNELWFYTCNMPGGKFLNRYLDSPLLNTRLLHWGNYKYNLTGYLHWGFNHYQRDQDPFEETSANEWLPAGDTHIVYPLKDGPIRSLRFQQMKCGVEDYEILKALSKQDKEAADRICRRAFRTFDDYITDVSEFDQIEDELIKCYDEC